MNQVIKVKKNIYENCSPSDLGREMDCFSQVIHTQLPWVIKITTKSTQGGRAEGNWKLWICKIFTNSIKLRLKWCKVMKWRKFEGNWKLWICKIFTNSRKFKVEVMWSDERNKSWRKLEKLKAWIYGYLGKYQPLWKIKCWFTFAMPWKLDLHMYLCLEAKRTILGFVLVNIILWP